MAAGIAGCGLDCTTPDGVKGLALGFKVVGVLDSPVLVDDGVFCEVVSIIGDYKDQQCWNWTA